MGGKTYVRILYVCMLSEIYEMVNDKCVWRWIALSVPRTFSNLISLRLKAEMLVVMGYAMGNASFGVQSIFHLMFNHKTLTYVLKIY